MAVKLRKFLPDYTFLQEFQLSVVDQLIKWQTYANFILSSANVQHQLLQKYIFFLGFLKYKIIRNNLLLLSKFKIFLLSFFSYAKCPLIFIHQLAVKCRKFSLVSLLLVIVRAEKKEEKKKYFKMPFTLKQKNLFIPIALCYLVLCFVLDRQAKSITTSLCICRFHYMQSVLLTQLFSHLSF